MQFFFIRPPEDCYIALADRVRTIISSPRAQIEQHATIRRSPSDSDLAWQHLTRELKNTENLSLKVKDDGSLFIYWYLDNPR